MRLFIGDQEWGTLAWSALIPCLPIFDDFSPSPPHPQTSEHRCYSHGGHQCDGVGFPVFVVRQFVVASILEQLWSSDGNLQENRFCSALKIFPVASSDGRGFELGLGTSTPPLPFKRPHLPTNRDHTALNKRHIGGSRYAPGTL